MYLVYYFGCNKNPYPLLFTDNRFANILNNINTINNFNSVYKYLKEKMIENNVKDNNFESIFVLDNDYFDIYLDKIDSKAIRKYIGKSIICDYHCGDRLVFVKTNTPNINNDLYDEIVETYNL